MITYQKVKSAPVDEIIALYKEGNWWSGDPLEESSLPQLIAGSFCFIIARNEEGKIIGMGRAISDGVSDAYIQDVVVVECYRKQGVGRQIIKQICEYCIQQNLVWIGLIAEPGTEKFYQHLGFKPRQGYVPMIYSTNQ
jgi:aralkylamine N-acetyltransferase